MLSDSASTGELAAPAPELDATGGALEEPQLLAALSAEPSPAEFWFGDISPGILHELERSYRV